MHESGRVRSGQARAWLALIAIGASWQWARPSGHSAEERAELAARFAFERHAVTSVPSRERRSVREVHPSLAGMAAWISAVGGALACCDLDDDGLGNELVYVDTEADLWIVEAAPPCTTRFEPFALDSGRLTWDRATMAPMGVVPLDLNEDGWLDLLAYAWGRSPIAYLRIPGSSLAADGFEPHELVAPFERWFTNAATCADLDGDGHLDLVVANYFPDGARILDARGTGTEVLHDSMTRAANGGDTHVFRFQGVAAEGAVLAPVFARLTGDEVGLTPAARFAWTLAVAAGDLDGDLLPELYFANDFAPDVLLHNRSTPGRLDFRAVRGSRTAGMPRSKTLGGDSFKGMGAEFADVTGDGRLDILVSNIADEFALQESHFVFAQTPERGAWERGVAPFVDVSEGLGVARGGWSWDVRAGDFDCDGTPEICRANGFLAGEVNRWPELHEIAMGNDRLVHRPGSWHRFGPGDALSGVRPSCFYVRARDGRYCDLAREIGIDAAVTRGVATADLDGDGDLDICLGHQWRLPDVYLNTAPQRNRSLVLALRLALDSEAEFAMETGPRPRIGRSRAAVGASARVRLPDGRELFSTVDGGNGHSGVRSPELHFGLGATSSDAPLEVMLEWRAPDGVRHTHTLELRAGWYSLTLGRIQQ